MRYLYRGVFVCLALLLTVGGVRLPAQQAQGSFSGTVTDPSGAVVPGVTVTATEKNTGFSRSVESSPEGVYTLPLLPPGNYVLTAEKAGFKRYTQGPIGLTVNQHAKIDIALEVGEQSATVDVQAAAPVLETESYSVGTTVGQANVSQLPFNGRQFLQATLFTPGVVPGSQGSELNDNRGGSINVNGMRETMNDFLLDGMNNYSIAVGTYAATPPLDSIQEFHMETGVYDARFGHQAGAQVNVVTKSGTNNLHGTAYEYLRNTALDARNFFEPTVPPLHRNQFGGSLGGPIVIPHVINGRDKAFFFFNYEGLRYLQSFYSRAHVPTSAEIAGDYTDLLAPSCSVKNVLINPVALLAGDTNINDLVMTHAPYIDAVGAQIQNLYPAPNIPNAPCGGENYTSQVTNKVYTNTYVARTDFRLGTKDNLFWRMTLTYDDEFAASGLPTGLPGYGTLRNDFFAATGIDWTHTFTPTVINEVKVDYNRWEYKWLNQDVGNRFGEQLGIKNIPTAPLDTGVPNFGIGGYDGFGANTSIPQGGAVNTYELADTISQIHGKHSLAYGVQIRSIKRGNFFENINARTNFDFSGQVTSCPAIQGTPLATACPLIQQALIQQFGNGDPRLVTFGNGLGDLQLGIPTSWINGFSGYISGTGSQYDFFGQDNWKVRRNLTLSLGLRYEYNSLVTAKDNRFGGFDFNKGLVLQAGTSAATLLQFNGFVSQVSGVPVGQFEPVGTKNLGGTSENRSLQRPDWNDIGPRIGFAWQPFNSAKTVVRGGGGVYYDQMVGELYFQKSFNPPFFQVSSGNLLESQAVLGQIIATCAPPTPQCPLSTGAIIQNVFEPTTTNPLFPTSNPVNINLQNSTIYMWSLDVQRELGYSWLLDVGYVGTRGLHLPFLWDPNQADNSNPALCTPGCPQLYPNYSAMKYTDSSGSSAYNALQVKVQRHFSRGLAVIGAYTYSKSLDTNSTYFSTSVGANTIDPNFPQNSYNRAAEKGRSDFDYRHRFSLSYVYNLPFGTTVAKTSKSGLNYVIKDWQLAGIIMLQSGSAYTPYVDGNPSHNLDGGNGNGTDRPNQVLGVPLYPANQTPNRWANPLAFAVPAQYTYGSAGRDILNGPGVQDWDFSLIRDFRLTESKTLEFRAEMFNIFNHANFSLPNGDASSASFGVIGNTIQPIAGQASGGPGNPRQIQFALRFIF